MSIKVLLNTIPILIPTKHLVVANTPIIEDKLQVRSSFLRENNDGYLKNETLADREVGGVDSWSGRINAKFIYSDELELDFELMSADRRGRGTPYEVVESNEVVQLSRTAYGALLNGSDLGTELGLGSLPASYDETFLVGANANIDLYDNKVSHNVASKAAVRVNWVGFDVNWELDDYNTLVLSSSYAETTASSLADLDGTPVNWLTLDIDGSGREFSQSLRLNGNSDSWDWLAGAIYYKTTDQQSNAALYDDSAMLLRAALDPLLALPLDALGLFACDPALGLGECGVGEERSSAKAITEGWAVYGDVAYQLSNAVKLTVGLRYSVEDKSIHQTTPQSDSYYNQYVQILDPTSRNQAYGGYSLTPSSDDTEYRKWTPRIALQYQLDEDIMLFTSIATGFKAGGFNPVPEADSAGEYDEEENTSYEFGMKSQWLYNRLQFNGSLYYSDYKGLQVEVNENGKTFTKNIPDVVSQGVEFDIIARPSRAVEIIANYSYNDTEFGDFRFPSNGELVDWTNNELPRAPQQTASLIAQYSIPLNDDLQFTLRGESTYSSDYYYTLRNSREEHQSGYTKFNMRITLAEVSGQWAVSLFGKNLGDREHSVSRIDPLGVGAVSIRNSPRFWGLDINYSL